VWADRVAHLLPPERLEITLEVTGDEARQITISGTTPRMKIVATHIVTSYS